MVLGEPALTAVQTRILASKKPITMQSPNVQGFPLTMLQKLRTQVSIRTAAIKITCEEVTNYNDKD